MPGRFVPPLENIGYVVDLDFYIYEQLSACDEKMEKGRKRTVYDIYQFFETQL